MVKNALGLIIIGIFMTLGTNQGMAQGNKHSAIQNLSSGQMKVDWKMNVNLGKGFDVIETFQVDGTDFVFCHNIGSGVSKIWNLKRGGDHVYDRKTYSGWSSFAFFQLDGKTYLFEFKKQSGHYQFYVMNADGSIGKRVSDKSQWSKGWTDFEVFYRAGKPQIMMMNASNGRAKVFEPKFD